MRRQKFAETDDGFELELELEAENPEWQTAFSWVSCGSASRGIQVISVALVAAPNLARSFKFAAHFDNDNCMPQ